MACYGAKSQQITKKNLTKKWKLVGYQYGKTMHKPSSKERGDYILLRNNLTYVSVSEGKTETGKWSFNTNGKYLRFWGKNGESIRFFVQALKTNRLVLKADIEDMRAIDIHYVPTK
ncbi:hypothetical protein BKI52_20375 [marine bacterium AO1-C]|nr:hypothetical protein BKI52_20375 [marine bacterium AO1-C]